MSAKINWEKRNFEAKSRAGKPAIPCKWTGTKATKKQREYLYALIDWIEANAPADHPCRSFDDLLDKSMVRRFDLLEVDAKCRIRLLQKISADLGRKQQIQKWYINIVKNKETGDRKYIKGKTAKACPVGYELIGTLKIVYEPIAQCN